jgi:hypothetical protein
MKGLFRSQTEMGIRGSWDKESDEDDSVVSEDRPWLPRSSDPDIGAGEYLSLEDDDSEESSTPRAIKTRNEGPKSNAALNLAAKTYTGKTFLLPNHSKYNHDAENKVKRKKEVGLLMERKLP